MPTGARKLVGYENVTEKVLAQASIAEAVANTDLEGIPGYETVKMYVNDLATIAAYVPGTGVSITNDGSSYVDIDNKKEKGLNEILDGYTVMTAPDDLIAGRLDAGLRAFGEQVDTDLFALLATDGVEANGTFGTTDVTITNFVVGTRYKVTAANTAGDATAIGCAAATAVVGETFVALTDGTGLTALKGVAVIKPTASTIYSDILDLKLALDKAKAPKTNRSLLVTSEMENLLLDTDSKVVLNTMRGDQIQTEGYVGRLLGFDIYSNEQLPTGTNMIALQRRGAAFKFGWKREPMLQSLDGSGQYIGDTAVQGRLAYVYGVVRPTLVQLNQGA
jgi:hypothetical protein